MVKVLSVDFELGRIFHAPINGGDTDTTAGFNYVLRQYTGATDWLGEEVFEGDIIEQWPKGLIFECVYKDREGRFCLETQTGVVSCESEYGKIIGNIYENPELLKQQLNYTPLPTLYVC